MNTETLLALIAPHAAMLKGLGCHVIPAEGDMLEVTTRDSVCPTCTIVIEHVARILADVCMEELERWAYLAYANNDARFYEVESDGAGGFIGTAYHRDRNEGPDVGKITEPTTRLSALLSLLQWAKSHP